MSTVRIEIRFEPQPAVWDTATDGRWQPWWWLAVSDDNGEVLAQSSERYHNHRDVVAAATNLFSPTTLIVLDNNSEATDADVVIRDPDSGSGEQR